MFLQNKEYFRCPKLDNLTDGDMIFNLFNLVRRAWLFWLIRRVHRRSWTWMFQFLMQKWSPLSIVTFCLQLTGAISRSLNHNFTSVNFTSKQDVWRLILTTLVISRPIEWFSNHFAEFWSMACSGIWLPDQVLRSIWLDGLRWWVFRSFIISTRDLGICQLCILPSRISRFRWSVS